jgi:ribosome-binding protein aMBF1 (putative translation factor)
MPGISTADVTNISGKVRRPRELDRPLPHGAVADAVKVCGMLKRKRRQLKLSCADLADALRVHPNVLSRWESASTIPPLSVYFAWKRELEARNAAVAQPNQREQVTDVA